MSRLLILILTLGFFSNPVAGQKILPDSLFQSGNTAMENDRFSEAVNFYEQILHLGYAHETLYYNLGNAYFRLGKLGQAIWAYEKGLQVSPRHTDLRFNRGIAKARIKDRIELPEGFILLEWYRALKTMVTIKDLLWVGSLTLLFGIVVSRLKIMRWNRNRFLVAAMWILFSVSTVSHAIAMDKYLELSDRKEGVVVTVVVEAHSSPSQLGKVLFRVHEGLVIEVTQTHSDWLEIILLDGKKGWVPAQSVRLL